jgi:anti-sigma regulatory factor (Ser/Thr protein kinase)
MRGDERVVERRLPHEAIAARLARETVRQVLADTLDEDRLHEAELVATELASNAFRHAPALPDGGIRLRLEIQDDLARIVVADGGNDFVPSWQDGAVASPDPHLGLLFVDGFADRWGISDDGVNAVWAEFDA